MLAQVLGLAPLVAVKHNTRFGVKSLSVVFVAKKGPIWSKVIHGEEIFEIATNRLYFIEDEKDAIRTMEQCRELLNAREQEREYEFAKKFKKAFHKL